MTKKRKRGSREKRYRLSRSKRTKQHITIKNTINKITTKISKLIVRAIDSTYVYFSDGVALPMFLESGPGSDSGVDGPIDWKGGRGEENRRDGGSG